MSVAAGVAAGARATSLAARLVALRERAQQLNAGVPVSIEHLLQARAWTEVQRSNTTIARERLIASHLDAADRQSQAATLLETAGRAEGADRLRRAAQEHERAATHLSGLGDDGVATGEPLDSPSAAPDDARAAAPVPPRQSAQVWRFESSPIRSVRNLTTANHRLAALVSSVAWSRSRSTEADRVRELWDAVAGECGTEDWRGWSHAVCEVGTRRLPTVSGIAITAFDGSIHQPLAASDVWTESAEDVQQVIGEGPSLTAYRQRRTVVVDDLAVEHRRWPGYVGASARSGLNSIWAVPLEIDGSVVGVITFYRKVSGAASRSEWSEVEIVAQAALTAAIGDIDHLANLSMWNPLTASAMVVHMATGVIATRLAISPEEALTRLRAQAFSTNRRLRSVADLVVSGKLTSC